SFPRRDELYRSGKVSKEQGLKTKQGFSYLREQVHLNKLVQQSSLRIRTCKSWTLISRSMKIIDTIIRRMINFIYLQETMWELDDSGLKLYTLVGQDPEMGWCLCNAQRHQSNITIKKSLGRFEGHSLRNTFRREDFHKRRSK
ncbi:hypothetical protein Lal_00011320, partial [Lupinus albus]